MEEIVQDIVARLLTEAYEQGGSLSRRDLSLIRCYDHSYLSELRLKYEKRKDTTLHFTGYDHNMGTAISHKTAILRKIFFREKRSGAGSKRDRSQFGSSGEVLSAV